MIHAIGMATASAVVVTSAFGGLVAAATLNVPGDFDTIQGCINAAVSGADECVVAPGTYNEAIDFLGKAIIVRSSDGADVTIIDGAGLNDSVVKCVSGEGPDTVLDGFTITGGTESRCPICPNSDVGGGMINGGSSPTVINCTFRGNTGGGMYNQARDPTIMNCTFSGNTGGGMVNFFSDPTVTNCTFSRNDIGMSNFISNPTVTDCTFSGNTGGGMLNAGAATVTNCTFSGNTAAGGGGGMWNAGAATVTNCTFSGNTATGGGGGMLNESGSQTVTVTNCTFSGNTANFGGGLYNEDSSLTVTNCTFTGNRALDFGGGIFNFDSTSTAWSPTMTNCTFSGNLALQGGGIFNRSGNPTVANCIFWGDSPEEIFNDGTTPSISYSDVQGGWPGEGNIDVDPLFVDADGLDDVPGTQDDNLRLLPGSPCIDAADNTAVPIGVTTDLNGNPRFVDDPFTPDTGTGQPPIVDMGAYEYQPLQLDIEPGRCPNVVDVRPERRQKIEVALVGTPGFEVWRVNLASITLSRTDGVGGTVPPFERRRRGRLIRFEDVAAAQTGGACRCLDTGADGIDDRVFSFSARQVVEVLELPSLEPGTVVTLALRGRLIDGAEFEACDCVLIDKGGRRMR